MLTPVDDAQPVTEAAASSPDKTVAIMHYGNSNTLLYTVPAGRTWVGCFWGTNAVEGYVVTSGSTFTSGQSNSNSLQSMWPPYFGGTSSSSSNSVLTLQAGDMLYSGTQNNYRIRIVGVESDA